MVVQGLPARQDRSLATEATNTQPMHERIGPFCRRQPIPGGLLKEEREKTRTLNLTTTTDHPVSRAALLVDWLSHFLPDPTRGSETGYVRGRDTMEGRHTGQIFYAHM